MSNLESTLSSPEELALAVRKCFQEFETMTPKTNQLSRMGTLLRTQQVIAAVVANPKLVTKEVMEAFPEEHLSTVVLITMTFFVQQIVEEGKRS